MSGGRRSRGADANQELFLTTEAQRTQRCSDLRIVVDDMADSKILRQRIETQRGIDLNEFCLAWCGANGAKDSH